MKKFIGARLAFLQQPSFFLWLITLALPVISIALAYLQASYFDGYPYDGPFQHLYPLREMDKGYFPGIDFNFFHGTAIPYVNYGVYKLVGGGIFGALFSAKLTQFFSVYLGLLFLCCRLFSTKSVHLAFFTIFGIMASETYFIGLAPLWDVSSFGIRTVAGLLVAGILIRQPRNEAFGLAFLAGVCILGVLLGTEQGFYCAAATVLVITLTNYCRGIWWRFVCAALFFAGFAIGLFVIVHLLFGSIDSLLFIRNVAADQVWYYGAPPVLFLRSLSEIYSNPQYAFLLKILGSSIAVGLIVLAAYKKEIISDGQYRALLFLLLWGWIGMTSNFSIVAYHYSEPLLRSMVIAILLIALSYIENNTSIGSRLFRRGTMR